MPLKQAMRRLLSAIREGDERTIGDSLVQLSRRNKIFAPAALAVGAFATLLRGLRLLVTNWRLLLVQALPAMLLWAVTLDLRVHFLSREEFRIIRGPLLLSAFAGVVAVTIAAFFFNAVFAFTISLPGQPRLRTGFWQARAHARALVLWGSGAGLALAVAAVLAPRWGLGWFMILLGTVLALMMLFYVTVPARIVGVPAAKPAGNRARPREKLTATALIGALGAIACAPPYAISRLGLVLLGSPAFFWLGLVILIIGLVLQAGITGAVKAVKVGSRLLAGGPGQPPPEQAE